VVRALASAEGTVGQILVKVKVRVRVRVPRS
jgi:hypothetical protein